ncbi:MAG: hypothetical protein LC657_19390, partial [Desulfobacteraceae bacterium]|nr:hypothetical protein [Desulfobacteraceae bacterium]
TNWDGEAPSGAQSIYRLTALDDAVLGDKEVMEADGDGLATVSGGTAGAAVTLNDAIAEQTLTVYDGPTGTSVIEVKDVGGDAKRSAASIAEALSQVDGVQAYASETSATLQLVDGTTDLFSNTEDGDEVQYTLYVDGILQEQSFIRDSSAGTLEDQFENSLLAAAQAVNQINEDKDLYVDGLTITSSSGRTLGIQDFEVQDNAGIRLDTFSDFDEGDTVTFTIDAVTTAGADVTTTPVSVDLNGVNVDDQSMLSLAFSEALSTALDGKDFSVTHDPSTNSVVVRTTDGSGIRLQEGANNSNDDAVVNITNLVGTDTQCACRYGVAIQ